MIRIVHRWPAATIALLVAGGAIGVGTAAVSRVGAQGTGQAAAAPVTDWRLTWSDEFSGTSLDTSKWGTCFPADRWTPDPCTTNADSEPATSEGGRIDVTGGALRLWVEKKPIVSSTTGRQFAYRGAMVQARRALSAPNPNVAVWETSPVDEASWKHVYVEARVKIPNGLGIWPSFWAMPGDSRLGAWPYSGEIDGMEYLPDATTQGPGGDAKFVQNLVWHGDRRGSDCTYPGNYYFTMCPNRLGDAGAAPWTGFHTFGYETSPSGVSFFIDGIQQRFLKRWTSTTNDVYPFDQAFFPILRMAVGSPPDYVTADPATWPVQSPIPSAYMEVDYIRVYQRTASWTPASGGSPTTTTPSATTTTTAPAATTTTPGATTTTPAATTTAAPTTTALPTTTTSAPTTTIAATTTTTIAATTTTTTIAVPVACGTESFESGLGAWTPWWTGTVSRSQALAHGGTASLAVTGSPATASRIVVASDCPGVPVRRIRFWVRAASASTSSVFIKTVDRATGIAASGAWYPVSASGWTAIDLPITTGPSGMLVGLDDATPSSAGIYVDDVELFGV